ncbi:unnamed protein product [Diamesa tonsa]
MIGKFLILFAVLAVTSAQKTPVYIYYEALCPDSQAFFTKQLYPTMKMLKDHVELHLVPFGKSTYQTRGGDTLFECHHGPNECYANKVHACAISHIQVDSFQTENTRETLTMEYVNCLMTNVFPDQPYTNFFKNCATATRVKNIDSIQSCANSTEGSKLLEQFGEQTNKFQMPLLSVPTISVRESFDAKIQSQAVDDLQNTICKNLPKPIPLVCRAGNGASATTPAVFVGIVAAFLAIIRTF